MKRTQGFSLIEILIVVSILGILLTMGFMSFQRYTWRTELKQAQNLLVNTINQARSDTRRTSQDNILQWTTTTVASGRVGNLKTVNLNDNNSISIVNVTGVPSATKSFSYVAPYARRATSETIVFTLQGHGGIQGTVKVIGVTGKAFAE
jgi:type IV pilus assembly protein PilA